MKIKRRIVLIDEEFCDGCGQCVPACAEGALRIVDGKAKIIADKFCDGLGACLGECPAGALRIIERETDDFDEQAVAAHLGRIKEEVLLAHGCACAGSGPQTIMPLTPCQAANQPVSNPASEMALGALTHWPVQIRLIPPTAPFLKKADLLVAADCAPLAYADFHRRFLAGRAVMIGCPKFDDAESYVRKFTEIFSTAGIKSVTILIMEVPCCSAMSLIVGEALRKSGKNIPVRLVVISTRGGIVAGEN